jgi:hypothetical protein
MSDSKIPIIFAEPGPGDTALTIPPGPGHVVGCLCCAPRTRAAEALARIYFARARGEVTFFTRLVARPADEAAIRTALATDKLAAARFRLSPVSASS